MSREAIAAIVLAGAVVAAAGLHLAASPAAWPAGAFAALVALAFVYCQGRMLAAAKGIPAWRSAAMPALVVATSLAEGAGAWWLAAEWHAQGTRLGLALFGAVVVARLFAWLAWRRTLAGHPRVAEALAPAGLALAVVGTLVPLALVAIAVASTDASRVLGLAATAGLLSLVAGAAFKVALIVRGAYNQGFAIPHMPVRGARG